MCGRVWYAWDAQRYLQGCEQIRLTSDAPVAKSRVAGALLYCPAQIRDLACHIVRRLSATLLLIAPMYPCTVRASPSRANLQAKFPGRAGTHTWPERSAPPQQSTNHEMSSKKSSLKGAGAPTAVPAAAPSKPAPAPTFGVPNRVGSLNFCPTCGNLLDIPGDDDTITCVQCGHTEDAVRASASLPCAPLLAQSYVPRLDI